MTHLSAEDRRHIDFSSPDRLKSLTELSRLTEKSREECIKKRWKYTRKSGETVVLRDLFDKVMRWINVFKEIGDVAVQYDPGHAALPWAGIRFVMQVRGVMKHTRGFLTSMEIIVSDHNIFGAVMEGLTWVAELICRHAVLEGLYLEPMSNVVEELRKALVTLYAAILAYLSKAKQYLEKGSASWYTPLRCLNVG